MTCGVSTSQRYRLRCRTGIHIERIGLGHPQQNGRHERMHLTLTRAAIKPAAANVLQQQARFVAFVEEYNHARLHQALGMQVPGDVYGPAPRRYHGPRWTAQNPPLIDSSKLAISHGRPRLVEFYFVASSGRRSVWTLVRQLLGPHLSTWA
jgi:hypothetical protein